VGRPIERRACGGRRERAAEAQSRAGPTLCAAGGPKLAPPTIRSSLTKLRRARLTHRASAHAEFRERTPDGLASAAAGKRQHPATAILARARLEIASALTHSLYGRLQHLQKATGAGRCAAGFNALLCASQRGARYRCVLGSQHYSFGEGLTGSRHLHHLATRRGGRAAGRLAGPGRRDTRSRRGVSGTGRGAHVMGSSPEELGLFSVPWRRPWPVPFDRFGQNGAHGVVSRVILAILAVKRGLKGGTIKFI